MEVPDGPPPEVCQKLKVSGATLYRKKDEEEWFLTMVPTLDKFACANMISSFWRRIDKFELEQGFASEQRPSEAAEVFLFQVGSPKERIEEIKNDHSEKEVFHEALQNAEDARATEMKIVLDERSYPAKSLLKPTYDKYQGPALILANDAEFDKQRDFDSLARISYSHKRDTPGDRQYIGEHGIGVLVYFTLSEKLFLRTNEHLLCTGPSGGNKYPLSRVQEMEDQMKPFKDYPDSWTVFRLPLRTTDSSKVADLLRDFIRKEVFECELLFLNSVSRLVVRRVNADGDEVCGQIEATRHRRDTTTTRDEASTVKTSDIHIATKSSDAAETCEWRVFRQLKKPKGLEKLADSIEKGHPRLAVALRLQPKGPIVAGRAFNALPLRGHSTGLPVHVSANFALHRERTRLRQRDDGLRGSWNQELIGELADLYLEALLDVAQDQQVDRDQYYDFWPRAERMDDYGDFKLLVDRLEEKLCDCKCLLHADATARKPRDVQVVLPGSFSPALQDFVLGRRNTVEVPVHVKGFFRGEFKLQSLTLDTLSDDLSKEELEGMGEEPLDIFLLELLKSQSKESLGRLVERGVKFPAEDGSRRRLVELLSPERSTLVDDEGKVLHPHFGKFENILSDLGLKSALTCNDVLEVAKGIALQLQQQQQQQQHQHQHQHQPVGMGKSREMVALERAERLIKYLSMEHPSDKHSDELEELEDLFGDTRSQIEWIPLKGRGCHPRKLTFDWEWWTADGDYRKSIRQLLNRLSNISLCPFTPETQQQLFKLCERFDDSTEGDLQQQKLDCITLCKRLGQHARVPFDKPEKLLERARVPFDSQEVLKLLDFVLKKLNEDVLDEDVLDDLQVPLLLLGESELSLYHFGGSRQVFASTHRALQPERPERFLWKECERVVEKYPRVVEKYADRREFYFKDFESEGVLLPAEDAQLRRGDAVLATPQLRRWLSDFIAYVDDRCGDVRKVPAVADGPLPVILTTDGDLLPLVSLEQEDCCVVDLLGMENPAAKGRCRSVLKRLGCRVLSEECNFKNRDQVCSPRRRQADFLLGKKELVEGLSDGDKNDLEEFALTPGADNTTMLDLPIFRHKGKHVAPAEKTWVREKMPEWFWEELDILQVNDDDRFRDLLLQKVLIKTPIEALELKEDHDRLKRGLDKEELKDLLDDLSHLSLGEEELRKFAALKLLPDNRSSTRRLADKFYSQHPLVKELRRPLAGEDLLESDFIDPRAALPAGLVDSFRVPRKAKDILVLVRGWSADEAAPPPQKPEAYMTALKTVLRGMVDTEIEELQRLLDAEPRELRFFWVKQKWWPPSEVHLERNGALGYLSLGGLDDCPAKKLLRPKLALGEAVRQLRKSCEKPIHLRGADQDFMDMYKLLNELLLEREGDDSQLEEEIRKLRRTRCLLLEKGAGDSDDPLLEYPHLMSKSLPGPQLPFVPVPERLKQFDSLLTVLGVQKGALPEWRRKEYHLGHELWERRTDSGDLKLVYDHGVTRVHKAVVKLRATPDSRIKEEEELTLPELNYDEAMFFVDFFYRDDWPRQQVVCVENWDTLYGVATDLQIRDLQGYLRQWSSNMPGP